MIVMLLGLLIFLGTHSVRLLADDWRSARIQQVGALPWKAAYSAVSLLGLALVIWGYGQTRLDPVWVWQPPLGLRHAVALLMIPAFVLLVAAYVPRNHLKTRLGHPMILAVKLWAFSHLLANGRLSEIVLFGAFLLWAVADFRAARRRPRPPIAAPSALGTAATVAIGLVAYGIFALSLHAWLIGVPVI
ncbi:NnrU protein [Halomonas sp. THAF5a]|uniref:NnrU family protein n=1 Tax=Halomonas sp. THAF5a TaxID=2587844 RepID=UPI0012680AC0|nr:NnrU family protein [Halomonas sp. THAF5a]QFU00736.1 NnrU protein [Halomonas sp. THAF5a]